MAGELYRGACASAREDLSVRSVDGCAGREQNLEKGEKRGRIYFPRAERLVWARHAERVK
jgi:hypothetical protein